MYIGAPVSAARSAGPGRDLRRGAEELDLDAAAGEVAVGDEPDRLVPAERGQQLPGGRLERHDRTPMVARVEKM